MTSTLVSAVSSAISGRDAQQLAPLVDGRQQILRALRRDGVVVKTFFSKRRLVTITPDVVTSYADERRAERTDEEGGAIPGAANGTINRELETLSKMLRLAYKNGKLTRLPFVEKLAEAPPRAGFVTREQFDTVRKRLPDELRAAMTVAYTFGWRKREVLDLKKHQYNSQDGTLRLDPGTTKNGDGGSSRSRRSYERCSMPRSHGSVRSNGRPSA